MLFNVCCAPAVSNNCCVMCNAKLHNCTNAHNVQCMQCNVDMCLNIGGTRSVSTCGLLLCSSSSSSSSGQRQNRGLSSPPALQLSFSSPTFSLNLLPLLLSRTRILFSSSNILNESLIQVQLCAGSTYNRLAFGN